MCAPRPSHSQLTESQQWCEVLSLVPERGRPLNAENPTGGIYQATFGNGRGLITYLLLADQDRVDVLQVTWIDLDDSR
ncbi:hypothetical protein [Kibdelosporangium philippinense]|uniref:hypothetical protein n=1 Tax=Kibdelosporangium philippinense TaxID=211113 RepID=UPI0036071266